MCIDWIYQTARAPGIFLCLWLLLACSGTGAAEDAAWQTDQYLDLALGAIEQPIWQPILLPGVEQQRGMPISPLYKQISPAAQLDFRTLEAFQESADTRTSALQQSGSQGAVESKAVSSSQSTPDPGQQVNSGGATQPANQPSPNQTTPNNPPSNQSPEQSPQINPPEFDPPDIPGPDLPGF